LGAATSRVSRPYFEFMAILQALLTLIGRSAGKVLNAIFGWAVRALFGQTSSRQQTFLSAIVAAAVAWPILLLGLAAPKVAALLLAFVPIPRSIPAWAIRLVWLGLAILVPLAVGLAMAAKAPPQTPPESSIKRMARGFPITVGLAAAFLIMFVSVPVMRFAALVRRLESADIPLVTDGDGYRRVAETISDVLLRHGFPLRSAQPGWWVLAPTRILTWFGGEAFRAYIPSRPEHFVSPQLELSLYPSGVLLRGQKDQVTWAHGLIAETVVHTDGLQTTDPSAQDLERQLRRLWKVFDENPTAHAASPRLLERLGEVTRDLGRLAAPFDDWQLLYRQILQVERALRGERQLLDDASSDEASEEASEQATDGASNRRASQEMRGAGREMTTMMTNREPMEVEAKQRLGTGALMRQIVSQAELLAKKELELAKAELRVDLRSQVRVAGGLGVAAVAGLITITLLLVTAALALSLVMPGWAAGLIVSGVMLAVAAIFGLMSWRRRLRDPMAHTRRTLKDGVKWTKERFA
jgi:hypothetical protein